MRYYSADYILPISTPPIEEGVVVVDNQGVIQQIGTRNDFPSADMEMYNGILIPGLINTHCHLELSHMKGLCPTGTKLIPFISRVVQLREFAEEVILDHIAKEDKNMWEAGIQAVGDISNKADTASQKATSKISYYTFIEMFDMMQPTMTDGTIENSRAAFTSQAHENGNKRSFVPHAPYSVTPGLFDFINKANPYEKTVSIHNTETQDENQMFLDGSGGFSGFFKGFGLSLDHFDPIGKRSIHYVIEHMKPKAKNIFVHNTLTTKEDIATAHAWSENIFWATCPNANLYIENRLPDYSNFIETDSKMTIGTDSIMSNWQLCVWEELKTINKMQSYVPLTNLLQWATLNGAKALDYDKTMGSLEVGKSPGLVHVELEWNGNDTDISKSKPKRIL